MQQSITLPYLRTSPVHIPRRDLVLSASDSLLLNVAVVESDNPHAPALILSTDIDGPSMQLVMWNESTAWDSCYDYQRPGSAYGTELQSVSGTPGGALGSWDFHLPTGTFANFPLRCGWSILLLWADGIKSSVLGQGIINVLRPFVRGVPLSALPPIEPPPIIPPGAASLRPLITSDTLRPMMTDDSVHILETS